MKLNHDTPLYFASVDNGKEGDVEGVSLLNLIEMVIGGQDLTKMTIFTDKVEAEKHAKRIGLLKVAEMRIEALEEDQLQEIVDAIAPDRIDISIDSLNHYCD